MSFGNLAGPRLTKAALADFDDIWRYTAETWSIEQADQYIDALVQILDMIVAMPSMAREWHELTPPVRIHAHQSHLIVYRVADNHIEVVRVLGGRQDWLSILKAADQ